jgi:hypothetical protein
MSRNHLTRWIETAEAREFVTMASERNLMVTETHGLHLGETIIRMPRSLVSLGSQAIAYVRRPAVNKY